MSSKVKKIEIFILYIYNEFDIPCFIVCSRNKNTQSLYGGYVAIQIKKLH